MSENKRAFAPIYKTFQELLDANQGIFKLFQKVKSPGLIQAIWMARQAEVDTLNSRLRETENQLQLSKDEKVSYQSTISKWKNLVDQKEEQINWHEGVKDSLKKQISYLEEELRITKANRNKLADKLDKSDKFGRDLDRALSITQDRLLQSHRKSKSLTENLQISNTALIQLDDDNTKLEENLSSLKSENYRLKKELEKAQSFAKQYRNLNKKMENELYRVNSEVEKFENLLN